MREGRVDDERRMTAPPPPSLSAQNSGPSGDTSPKCDKSRHLPSRTDVPSLFAARTVGEGKAQLRNRRGYTLAACAAKAADSGLTPLRLAKDERTQYGRRTKEDPFRSPLAPKQPIASGPLHFAPGMLRERRFG